MAAASVPVCAPVWPPLDIESVKPTLQAVDPWLYIKEVESYLGRLSLTLVLCSVLRQFK